MMLKIFSERITHLTELAANLSLYSVRTRLARFLIEIADSPQASGGWTQDEIAAHIGTVRDVVGRLLRELESSNIILRDRQRIRLIDRQALIKQAEQEDS
jgi:CRP/FNR family cyclic AMP-dependent transcriptional regulator